MQHISVSIRLARDRDLIIASGRSDADLAQLLGVARSTIWRARTERCELSADKRQKLEEHLPPKCDRLIELQALEELFEQARQRPSLRRALALLGKELLHKDATSAQGEGEREGAAGRS